jgi:hypothetical protein
MRVEVAIGEIVDGAARGAHENRAGEEDEEDVELGQTVSREPQAP